MALARTPRLGYTGHPLTWERTDLGRPLMRLAVILLALLAIGAAVALLFMALAGPGTPAIQGGLGQAWPLSLFSLFFLVTFYWPANVICIFVLALPIIGIIWWLRPRSTNSGTPDVF